MTRVSILETKEMFSQKHIQALHETYVRTSEDIREMRDVIIGSNLADLPKRVENLEKSRWIGHGVAGSIGGGVGITIMKVLGFIGMMPK